MLPRAGRKTSTWRRQGSLRWYAYLSDRPAWRFQICNIADASSSCHSLRSSTNGGNRKYDAHLPNVIELVLDGMRCWGYSLCSQEHIVERRNAVGQLQVVLGTLRWAEASSYLVAAHEHHRPNTVAKSPRVDGNGKVCKMHELVRIVFP